MENTSKESKIKSELQTYNTDLLAAILKGDLDMKFLAHIELKSRYVDPDGKWVGPQWLKDAWKDYVVTVVDGKKHLIRKYSCIKNI